MKNSSFNYKTYLVQLDELFGEYLGKKAPSLPKGVKEAIVKFGPYIALIFTILAIPGILLVLGLGTLLTPFSFFAGVTTGFNFGLGVLFTLITFVMGLVAIPGLFKRAKKSWDLIYYATLLGVLQNIITFNLGGLVIGSLLSLYFLYQVKEYYK